MKNIYQKIDLLISKNIGNTDHLELIPMKASFPTSKGSAHGAYVD